MDMKDYTLTCGEVIDNLLTLADAYEKASAGKAPNGFAFNPADAAANIKAAVHFIGSFGQQVPQWIPVSERLPDENRVLIFCPLLEPDEIVGATRYKSGLWLCDDGQMLGETEPTHWMPLPQNPRMATP